MIEVIMAHGNDPNEQYWQVMADRQIEQEFARYLRAEGLALSPDSAQTFAMRKIAGGYRGKSERELILLLAGQLPFAYD